MGIDIQGHANLTMPQDFLHHLWVCALTQHDCGRTMSQVMKAHMRQASLLEHVIKRLAQGGQADVVARCTCEHKSLIGQHIRVFTPLLVLFDFMID